MNITIKVFVFMAATSAAFVAGKTTPREGIVIPLMLRSNQQKNKK